MKRLNYFISFLVLFVILIEPVFSAEKKKIQLKWKEAPTAISYIVEIRNEEKKVIFKEETTETNIIVELELGNYERKISIYNKLEEIEVESEWAAFKVSIVLAPELDENSKFEITKSAEPAKINLRGKNFSPDMKVKLVSEGKEYPAKSVEVISPTEAEVVIDSKEIPEGSSDLVLENSRKSSSYPRAVETKSENVVAERTNEPPKDELGKWDIVKRSAVLPGWGEYYAGKKLENSKYDFRGKLYFGSFMAATLLYFYFNEFTFPPGKKTPTEQKLQEDSARNFSVALVLPNLSNNSRRFAALYGLTEMQSQQNKVDDQIEKTNIMLALMFGIYVTQLVDAYLIERDLGFHPKVIFSITPEKSQLTNTWEPYYKIGVGFSF